MGHTECVCVRLVQVVNNWLSLSTFDFFPCLQSPDLTDRIHSGVGLNTVQDWIVSNALKRFPAGFSPRERDSKKEKEMLMGGV